MNLDDFNTIYVKHWLTVKNASRRIINNEEHEDAMQEAWIQVWLNGDAESHTEAEIKTWIWKVTVNEARMVIRKKYNFSSRGIKGKQDFNESEDLELPESVDYISDPMLAAQANQVKEEFIVCLDGMSSILAEAFVGRVIEMKEYEELMAEKNISHDVLDSRVVRSSREIKKHLSNVADSFE